MSESPASTRSRRRLALFVAPVAVVRQDLEADLAIMRESAMKLQMSMGTAIAQALWRGSNAFGTVASSALHRAASCAASCGAARRTLCIRDRPNGSAFALALVQAAKQAETMASVGSLTLGVVAQLSLEWRRAHEQWQVRLVPRSRTARITVSA